MTLGIVGCMHVVRHSVEVGQPSRCNNLTIVECQVWG